MPPEPRKQPWPGIKAAICFISRGISAYDYQEGWTWLERGRDLDHPRGTGHEKYGNSDAIALGYNSLGGLAGHLRFGGLALRCGVGLSFYF